MSIRIQGNIIIDNDRSGVNFNTISLTNSSPLTFTTTSMATFNHASNSTPVAFQMNKGGTSFSDGSNFGVLQLSRTNHNNGATSAGAALYFVLKDSGGTSREYAGIYGRKTVAGASGGELVFMNYGRNEVGYCNASLLSHVSSVRAPIFFDSNNTAFFVDPNSNSNMSRLLLGGGAGGTGAGLSVQSVSTSSGPIVAKSTNHPTVWSILPWSGGITYISSGIYYQNGSWIHASADTTNCLLALRGSGPTWYSSNNSSGSWNLASDVPLWSSNARWINNVTAPNDVRAPNFSDGTRTYNVNLGSGGSEGRGLVAGYSGGSYGGIGYNVRHTTSSSTYIAPSTDTVSYLDFRQGGFWFLGAGTGTAGRSLGLSTRAFLNSSSQLTVNGDVRSPIFYDSNNTAFYVDPNSNSELNEVYIQGWFRNRTSGRGLYNQATTRHFYSPGTSYWHLDGGSSSGGLIIYDRYNSSQGNATGRRGYLYYNSSGFGLLHQNGGWAVRTTTTLTEIPNRLDTPIMYDSNNTGFFVDPASTSRMNLVRPTRLESPFAGTNSGLNRASYAYNFGFQNTGAWSSPFPDLVLHYHTGIIMAANPSYQGIRFLNDYNNDTLRFQINGGSSYTYKYTWMYTNTTGYYSDTNGWHIEPNTTSAYGSMRIRGSRGGYFGINLATSRNVHYMWDSSSNGGSYIQTGGRWPYYYNYSNNCLGIVGSATSSAYGLYVSKAIFSTSNIVAYSDARKKENIITVDNALEKINQLRGVYYNRIDQEDEKREIGVIAQEVDDVLPEVVTYAEDVDEYGVSYGNLAGLFIEAIKEQNKIIESMKQEISELKEKIGEQ
jgi:hypothetical protein